MMLLPGPGGPELSGVAGGPTPLRREARGLKERQRKTKAQSAMRERSSMPRLLGDSGGCSCFTWKPSRARGQRCAGLKGTPWGACWCGQEVQPPEAWGR